MPKNHENVKLGKKGVPFREKLEIRFAIQHGGARARAMVSLPGTGAAAPLSLVSLLCTSSRRPLLMPRTDPDS